MPVDPISVASIAGNSLPSTKDFLNSFNTMFTNYQNQRFAKNMYKMQRNDAIAFWNMQNEYNDPKQQMSRLTAAGLNPHLVYGGSGNSGQAGPIPTPDVVTSGPYKEPRFEGNTELMPSLLGAADLRIKGAQADNLEVQNDLLMLDLRIREKDLYKRDQEGQRLAFDLDLDRQLADVSADTRREQLRKLRIENSVTLNRDAREAAMNSSNLSEALERMYSMQDQRKTNFIQRQQMRQQIELMKQDGTLKRIEIELRRNNINPNAPVWEKYIGLWLGRLFDEQSGSMRPIDGWSVWKSLFK